VTPSANTEKSAYVRRMFARIVSRYDLMNRLMSFGRDRAWRRMAAQAARAGGSRLALDVASGTGDLTLSLADEGFEQCVGVDFCQEMVEAAFRKPLKGRPVRYLVGDGQQLPFDDDRFDAVTSGYALRNFGSLPTAMAEMARVVKPGGVVVALELTRPTFPPVAWLYRPFLSWLVPLLGLIVTGDRAAYAYLPESLARHPAPSGIAEMMRGVGLEPLPTRLLALGTVAIHSGTKRRAT
jgi:demethylmenaquinone methyltransferase / 2-methoxy-6-polyprenyl-1,4-benzoquinol methylase